MLFPNQDRPITIDPSFKKGFKECQKLKLCTSDSKFQEPLVDCGQEGLSTLAFYHHQDNPPYFHQIPGSLPIIYLRSTVVQKLKAINIQLNQMGLELLLFDGYRPLAVQNYFFYHWVPKKLKESYPNASDQWIENEASLYWSPGAKTKEELDKHTPPHSTGGAIDLSIRFKSHKMTMEMGTLFDDTSPLSHTDAFEHNYDEKSYTHQQARINRRLLYHIMREHGFTNHPFEWWHYSYGDHLWAYQNDQKPFYGYAGEQLGETI